jgi:hypothetical protein
MMSGTFSFEYTLYSDGPDGQSESSGTLTMDGANYAIRQEGYVDGEYINLRVIIKDGRAFYIDDQQKYYMEVPAESVTADISTDFTSIVKTGEGMGVIRGKTLPYVEYSDGAAGSSGSRFYLEGGEVYGIVSEDDGYVTTMIVTNQSGSVPAGAFDIPPDYTDLGDFLYG